MARQRMNVQAPVERLFAERWSTRAFAAGTPVTAAQLASCLEAARWTPSCFGEAPWRFVIADRFADENAWRGILNALAEKNRLWAQNAPVLIATACTPTFAHNGQPNRWCEYDAGQAAMSLCLQATALGLAAHQMGGFDIEAVRKTAGLPADWQVMSVTALGHPAAPEAAPEPFRDMETAPRTRTPIEEIAHAGHRDNPWRPPAACGWEARYQESEPEQLPWFHDGLDADIGQALDELGLTSGRLLDLGCGPGTQAVALAARGFTVTASDISPSAVAVARARAETAGAQMHFAVDDVLDSRLDGPFDIIIDRGVFHCFAEPDAQAACLATLRRLLAAGGYLLLKCFHKDETSEMGPPGRYGAEDIRRLFADGFSLLAAHESRFVGPGNDTRPKALFCILQRNPD